MRRLSLGAALATVCFAYSADEPRDLDIRRMNPANYYLPANSWAVTEKTPGPAGQLSLVALPDASSAEVGGHRGMRLLIVNKSEAAPKVLAYDREQRLLMLEREALDVDGKWKEIEEPFCPVCGTGMKQPKLEAGRCWELPAVRYTGRLKTRVRFRLIVFEEKRAWAVYSNEFDGSVNPEQFVPQARD